MSRRGLVPNIYATTAITDKLAVDEGHVCRTLLNIGSVLNGRIVAEHSCKGKIIASHGISPPTFTVTSFAIALVTKTLDKGKAEASKADMIITNRFIMPI